MEIVKGGREYFNKRYVKDHPYSLFIYEDTLEDMDFEDFSNVFPIITYDDEGRYFRDKHLEKNKKIIRDCIEDIQKSLKRRKYKKIILPEKSIGKGKSKLHDREPKTYAYIKRKLNEFLEVLETSDSDKYKLDRYKLDRYNRYKFNRYSRHKDRGYQYHYPRSHKSRFRTRYNSNSNSTETRKIRKKVKDRLRKKSKKGEKKKKMTTITNIEKASTMAQKKCNDCIKSRKLLDQDLYEKNDKRSRKFVRNLEKAEKKCLSCHKLCKYLDNEMKPDMNNADIYQARYPSICLNDEEGNKRVFRLMNSYRNKMLQQLENYDLNFEN